jgi:uncharacterized protein YegL
MFDPSQFSVTKARPIPVYLLLDTSGSMRGAKIDSLNEAVRQMLASFTEQELAESIIEVGIITFGGDQAVLVHRLARAGALDFQPLQAAGLTPMGDALGLIKSLVEDRQVTPSNAYRPTVILVSDGEPNDQWEQPLAAFIGQGRSAKCDRMAMAIGKDHQAAVLKCFTEGTGHPLFTATDSAQLHTFFRLVTMSVVARLHSLNPNEVHPLSRPSVDETAVTDDLGIW